MVMPTVWVGQLVKYWLARFSCPLKSVKIGIVIHEKAGQVVVWNLMCSRRTVIIISIAIIVCHFLTFSNTFSKKSSYIWWSLCYQEGLVVYSPLSSDHSRAPPWSSDSMLDHRSLSPCSNLSMGISESCFIFDFASLPLEVAWPI